MLLRLIYFIKTFTIKFYNKNLTIGKNMKIRRGKEPESMNRKNYNARAEPK